MITHSLSLRKAFNFAWTIYRRHYGLFTAILLTFFFSWVLLEVIVVAVQKYGLFLWATAHLIFLVFFAGAGTGFIQISLAIYEGRDVSYSDLFRHMHLGPKFLAAQFIYFAMILAGLPFLIIPGVYLGIRYSLFSYYLIEGRSDLKESFRQSYMKSQGAIPSLSMFFIIVILFNLAGAALLGVGLIITIPVSILAKTALYRQLD